MVSSPSRNARLFSLRLINPQYFFNNMSSGDLNVLPSVAGALSSSGAISDDPAVLNSPYNDRYIWDSPNPYGCVFRSRAPTFVFCALVV